MRSSTFWSTFGDFQTTPQTENVLLNCLPFPPRSNFFLSDEKLTCAAIFPDAGLELLAGGDERGALSLWYRSGDECEEGGGVDLGRPCRFVPHSDEVTAVEFSRADRSVRSTLDSTRLSSSVSQLPRSSSICVLAFERVGAAQAGPHFE